MRPDFGARRERLAALLEADGFDGLLVSELANIRYLTGFDGGWGRLVQGPLAHILVVDARYRDRAPDLPAGVELLVAEGVRTADAVREAVGLAGCTRLAFEPGALSWWEHGAISSRLQPGSRFSPAGGHVEALRAIKDEGERKLIAHAAAVTDRAIAAALACAVPGEREIDVAATLAAALRREGDGGAPAFEPLVAGGAGTARIHARPSRRRLESGDLLLVDAGATISGLAADCARTVVVGERPDRRQREGLDVVQAALEAAIRCAEPGRPVRDLVRAAERRLARHGFGLAHDLGHGVGLEVHEEPRVAADSDAVLAAGMVVAIEPGIYVPGWGGVRIEETVEVTPEGPLVLTAAPRFAGGARF
ncbi:MAG: aminopeptidase P family protein [Candidatus Sericytochromatia bacterium]|nr:aminopeptidase P family protein [Candidatus Tanganyikabacteria bacterium]